MNKNLALHSNIYKFQTQHNFADFAALYKWSITDRAAFWDAAIQAVGITFTKPYKKVLDLADGVAAPQWLVHAKLNIVNSCFKANPHKTAIIFQDENGALQHVTYRALHIFANRVANSLQQFKLAPGTKIAIAMPMTVEAVAIYLGIIQAGFVAVGIADSFAAVEVAKRLEISAAKLLFTQDVILRDGKTLDLYAKLQDIPIPKVVLPARTQLCVPLKTLDRSWQEFLVMDPEFTAVTAQPHDPINILFSSGTTGDPKAIVWDHSSPIKCAVDGYLYQDMQPDDIVAWPTSLGWMMGPWLIFAALINQATIALFYDAPTTRHFTEFVAKARVTILGLVPSLVKAWRLHDATNGLDWSAIKLFTSTGETSNAPDMQYLSNTAGGKPIIEYCGGTEISGAYVTSTVLQENIPANFSTPTLGIDLLLLDENGKPADIGEVALVAPSIGLSRVLLNRDNFAVYYEGMPTAAPGTLLRRHGDQMQRLPNGYYKSLGRADDAMNLGGIKISAAEIEHCFLEIDSIVEAVAVCKETPDAPGRLVIFAVFKDPHCELDALQQQMQHAINTQLNPLFKISELKIIDAIPRTSSNKIMRRLLR
jgi:acetyl-CoA synthetase